MTKNEHNEVEFAVDDAQGEQHIFKTFGGALAFAAAISASDGRWKNVDVLIYSKAGAKWWGGEDAVDSYLDDPDASVSERITIRAESQGRIP